MYLQLLLVCTIVAVAVGRSHKFCFIIWTIVKLFVGFSYNRLFTILHYFKEKAFIIWVYNSIIGDFYVCGMFYVYRRYEFVW